MCYKAESLKRLSVPFDRCFLMTRFLASLIFYPLLFLRPRFMILSYWIIWGCVLGGMVFLGFWFFGHAPIQQHMWLIWASLIVPFVIFVLRHFYDRLLLALNPTGKVLLLSQ